MSKCKIFLIALALASCSFFTPQRTDQGRLSFSTRTFPPLPKPRPPFAIAPAEPVEPSAPLNPLAASQSFDLSKPIASHHRDAQGHTVQAGETLSSLSRAYGVSLRAVIAQNSLTPPYGLSIGQEIIIPQGREHRVVKGDTVYSLSLRYDLPIAELAARNGLQVPYTLFVGQRLIVPGVVEQRVLAENPRSSLSLAQTPPDSLSSQSVTPQSSEPLVKIRPRKRPLSRSIEPSVPQAPARTSSRFLRPVQGKVISGFGPKAGGIFNDGINIAARLGTPVRAAENGVVVYAGSRLKGFGQMLLIKHADGWLTAYAHNSEILVAQGDIVRRGQPVARAGQSGNVDRPQLHFEVRQGEKSLNPLPLLDQ